MIGLDTVFPSKQMLPAFPVSVSTIQTDRMLEKGFKTFASSF
jgi:hypothetical protein